MTFLDALRTAPLVERLGWTLVHSLWQMAAVAGLFVLAASLLRGRSPQWRYLAGCAALALMAVLPVATCWMLDRPASPTSGGTAAATPAEPADGEPPASTAMEGGLASRPAPPNVAGSFADRRHPPAVLPREDVSPRRAESATLASLRAAWSGRLAGFLDPALLWLVAGWCAGVLLLSLWHCAGWLLVRRLRREAAPAADARSIALLAGVANRLRFRQPVVLLESHRVGVPVVIGWLRPAILAPFGILTGLPADQLQAVLAHELAHIRRHDYLVNLLQTVVETLLFYHPAVWWVSYRVRQEREHCADDLAVAACGDRIAYASALTALEERCAAVGRSALAATDGSLRARVRHVLRLPPGGRSPGRPGTAGAVIAFVLAAAMFLLTASAGAPRPTPTAKAAKEEAATDPSPAVDKTPVAGDSQDGTELRDRLESPPRTIEAAVSQVDRRRRIVWFNAGSADHVKPGTQFSVYPPDLRKDERRLENVKASLEVIQVLGPRLASARILKEADARRPVVKGDVCQAAVPMPREGYAFVGVIDFGQDGIDPGRDGEENLRSLRRMVHAVEGRIAAYTDAQGNRIGGEIDPHVRFVVVGRIGDPAKASTPEERQALQATSHEFRRMLAEARELGIRVIPFASFLQYIESRLAQEKEQDGPPDGTEPELDEPHAGDGRAAAGPRDPAGGQADADGPQRDAADDEADRLREQAQIRETIARGADSLRRAQNPDGTWAAERERFRVGVTSLCTLALLRAGAALDDPAIEAALGSLRNARPDTVYEVALQTLVFCVAEPERDRELIQGNAAWLENVQIQRGENRGGWSYGAPRQALVELGGDNSNSRFALWALDAAASAGANVKRETWQAALGYWRERQSQDGGWGYAGRSNLQSTGSMTCAGIVSSTICSGRLAGDQDGDQARGLREEASVGRALLWLEENFSVRQNPGTRHWKFYYLMTLRHAGQAASRQHIGEHDWYREGAKFLVETQSPGGVWRGEGHMESQPAIATAMALLFLAPVPE